MLGFRGGYGSDQAGRLTAPSSSQSTDFPAHGSEGMANPVAHCGGGGAAQLPLYQQRRHTAGSVGDATVPAGEIRGLSAGGSNTSCGSNPFGDAGDGGGEGDGSAPGASTGAEERSGRGASTDERWDGEPLVSVEILGHCWAPDVSEPPTADPSAGSMHLEFMLKTVGSRRHGPLLVQRRYRDFDRLHTALGPVARRAGVPLPQLPTRGSYTLSRNLTEEFATQRQACLQQWCACRA